MDYEKLIEEYLEKEISIIKKLDIKKINDVINVINGAYKNQSKIFVSGNGGSAATASHFCNDFNKGISEKLDKKFKVICLNDNMPTVLAIANDIGYEDIFKFQLIGHITSEDLIIAISGSGNSKNIIKAVEYAKFCGCKIIGVTGYDGGKLLKLSDYSLHVPIKNMQITEDVHLIFNHLIMSIFQKCIN